MIGDQNVNTVSDARDPGIGLELLFISPFLTRNLAFDGSYDENELPGLIMPKFSNWYLHTLPCALSLVVNYIFADFSCTTNLQVNILFPYDLGNVLLVY